MLKPPRKRAKRAIRVWLHAVSVGEVMSCGPLIRLMRENGHDVVLSTGTLAGHAIAEKQFPGIEVLYFPFDYGFMVRRFLTRIDPHVVLLCETELWPAFVNAVSRHGAPLYLVSGRLGDREFCSYRALRFFFNPLLRRFTGLFMQSELDAERMRAITDNPNIGTLGNLKFDVRPEPGDPQLNRLLPDGRRICAASTHREDERIIVKAFAGLARSYPDLSLVLVPRHPHRAAETAALLTEEGLTYTLRSENKKCATPVFLVDSVGELMSLFANCDIVIMGGSFSRRVGGHNPIEPALYGKCVLCGPHMENFREAHSALKQAHGMAGTGKETLGKDLAFFMEHPSEAERIGENAAHLMESRRGASRRVVDAVFGSFNSSASCASGRASARPRRPFEGGR
ncbi:MAG: 3-deoxy-D-manno-octulosonic acid transferase [Deltaproteobacteria bacterium]|nr:3-deoxy-D-manno-octulosonic acid transferase [Deltaproteobacteria bacterium]